MVAATGGPASAPERTPHHAADRRPTAGSHGGPHGAPHGGPPAVRYGDLPPEIHWHILRMLPDADARNARLVDRDFRDNVDGMLRARRGAEVEILLRRARYMTSLLQMAAFIPDADEAANDALIHRGNVLWAELQELQLSIRRMLGTPTHANWAVGQQLFAQLQNGLDNIEVTIVLPEEDG